MEWQRWNLLILPYLSGITSQMIKFINYYIQERKLNFNRIIEMGGMPSTHSAATITLATLVGIKEGFDSVLFAIIIFISLFIMGEAAGVRRAAGKQAELINKLTDEFSKDKKYSGIKLKVLIGHTPVEVIMGSILGLVFALAFAGG